MAVNFCPEAWYLQRRHVVRTRAGAERLDARTRAHRYIGQQTDSLQRLDSLRSLLLAATRAGSLASAWVVEDTATTCPTKDAIVPDLPTDYTAWASRFQVCCASARDRA